MSSSLPPPPTPFPPTTAYSAHPENVGIHAIDIYFPSTYITQQALEQHNNIPAGKYTIGLGQLGLSYVTDREDIYSISLSAVSTFMNKYNISYNSIGRLEVGSETILDHSKSIKSVLMQLFAESGNTDVEGIDSMNACYAGTHALFNSIDWVESSAFDGRYALVVAADIAEYAEGPARPTGGCGAVVMLIGPSAPLVFDRGCRSSHMEHAWDFYKPNMLSPYPVVDGKFSNSCYLRALDTCYQRYVQKTQQKHIISHIHNSKAGITLQDIDYVVLHAPYNKLTQKGYARLYYNDAILHPDDPQYGSLLPFLQQNKDNYNDVALEKALLALSKDSYPGKVGAATLLPQQIGNMYTASLYAGILSLVDQVNAGLVNKRILCFSYGSGLAASVFSVYLPTYTKAAPGVITQQGLSVSNNQTVLTADLLRNLSRLTNLTARLAARVIHSPAEFTASMLKREKLHGLDQFVAEDSVDELAEGTWYLVQKDEQSRRQYQRKESRKETSNTVQQLQQQQSSTVVVENGTVH